MKMKIVLLQVENVKGLIVAEVRPDQTQAVIQVTGPNGSGKSSLLDSIWWALAGERSHQPAPIREGQRHAKVRLDLGEIVVTREWELVDPPLAEEGEPAELTTKLFVESADGTQRFKSPQSLLTGLLDKTSFDPMEFSRMKPAQQLDVFKTFVDFDWPGMERSNKLDYDRRRDFNRDEKRLETESKAKTDTLPAVFKVSAAADLEGIEVQIRDAERKNEERVHEVRRQRDLGIEIDKIHEEVEREKTAIIDIGSRILKLQQEIVLLQEQADGLTKKGATNEDVADEMMRRLSAWEIPEKVDIEALRQEERDGRAHNALLDSYEEAKALALEAKVTRENAEACTIRIDARHASAREAVRTADLPVKGLSVSAAGTLEYMGHPFEQASDAERIRVSCALAMRKNAELRILRVRNGNDLDDNSLQLLEEMAEAEDYQVWIERVAGSGKVGIVMEAGRVKSDSADGSDTIQEKGD